MWGWDWMLERQGVWELTAGGTVVWASCWGEQGAESWSLQRLTACTSYCSDLLVYALFLTGRDRGTSNQSGAARLRGSYTRVPAAVDTGASGASFWTDWISKLSEWAVVCVHVYIYFNSDHWSGATGSGCLSSSCLRECFEWVGGFQERHCVPSLLICVARIYTRVWTYVLCARASLLGVHAKP